jgi:DNA-binding SARP family transcriptional activator
VSGLARIQLHVRTILNMHTAWRVQLLGSLRASIGERIISHFRTEKTGSLFAFLAFHRGRVFSREVLSDMFWPDADPESSRHSLRLALSSLRSQFTRPNAAKSLIQSDRKDVWLETSLFSTDVADFDAALAEARGFNEFDRRIDPLVRAIKHYSGSLLSDYYDSWITPHQIRLQAEFIRIAVELAAGMERLGRFEEAANYASRAVREDSLSEEAQAVRLRAAIAAGPAAAAQVYREIETTWRDELDEPVPQQIRSLAAALPQQALLYRKPPPDFSRNKPLLIRNAPNVSGDIRLTQLRSSHFFGRYGELAALTDLVSPQEGTSSSARGRLITLTGPGGTGKTRLAEELLRALAGQYESACWLVRLSDLTVPTRLAAVVRVGMGLPSIKDVPPFEAICRTLSQRPSLLILDNLEQLLPGATGFLDELLSAVPSLNCVITSRKLAALPQEHEFPVLPLPVPSGRESLELLRRIPSVELFLERARLARPDFRLSSANAQAVAEICSRLEGMPLAVELSAARSYSMSPAQMVARLSDRYEFLAGRNQAYEARHKTMRATVGWSYELLSSDAQTFYRQLSVFRGGWTAAAARAVCETENTQELLQELTS